MRPASEFRSADATKRAPPPVDVGLLSWRGTLRRGRIGFCPCPILGVLLVFAGAQLTLTIMDLKDRKDYFVAILILGITLASNLAAGFIAGMVVAQLLRWKKLTV